MGKLIDLTGKTFGRWTVLYRTDDYIEPSGAKRARYHCKCACGNEADVLAGSLRKGQSKSCGCLQREFAKSGAAKRTHGATGTRLHRIWKNMNTRCNNHKNQKYPRYDVGFRCVKDGVERLVLKRSANGPTKMDTMRT